MPGVASTLSRLTFASGSRHVLSKTCLKFPSSVSARLKSTLSVVEPSKSAQREVPTPLLFLSASKWASSDPAQTEFSEWVSHFTSQGYQSMLLDLNPEQDLASIKDSAKLMAVFQEETQNALRDANVNTPFPPIMIAKGPATMIAEWYVSSRPVTALQLVDPPITNAHLRKDKPDLLPNELKEFDFEATFPVRVVWSQTELSRQQKAGVSWYDAHRIEHQREDEAGESLDRYTYDTDLAGAKETQDWLENEIGVPVNDLSESVSSEDDVEFELDDEDGSESPASTSLIDAEHREWFAAGNYKLQPGARKFPLTLDEKDLTEKFVRGSGPGGQAINKLSINVQLVHVPTGTRVTCQDTRSRERNRELARRKLSKALEHLVLKSSGGSRVDREIEKKRKQKSSKKRKQKRKQALKLKDSTDLDTSE